VRPAIYAAGVDVDVDGHRLLEAVDITVGAGDWVNILGPNGAGKSTLLRALAGIVGCAGRIDLFGCPLSDLDRRSRARLVAHVPQRPEVPIGMTVEHSVLLGRTPHLRPLAAESAADFAIVERTIDLLRLGDLRSRTLTTLSGGERQRVALARALAQEPRLLLLDEPTTALDVGHQQEVLELIDALRAELGLTVVTTMHDLTLAAQYGDQLVLLAAGRVVAEGPPVQVLTGPEVAAHYRARVDVIRHEGTLVVVPLRSRPPESVPTPEEDPDART
jgi:iron complex transport system ATP-binding protein